jgi:hypothetical protein
MKPLNMAIITILILFCAALSSLADEVTAERDVRGISFTPMVPQIVQGTVKLDIPFSCQRLNSMHQKEKYPITFFQAHCPGKNPCLSINIMVMLIADSIRPYDEIKKKSEKEDFGAEGGKVFPEFLIESKESGADKTAMLVGSSFAMGTHIIGYYYSNEKKITSKVIVGLIYGEKMSDDEWQYVLAKSIQILRSVKLIK